MIIVTYKTESAEVPEARRWIAQIEKIKQRLYVTFHGATEDEARQKAQDYWDKIPKKEAATTESPAEQVSADPVPVIDAVPEQPKKRRVMDDL